MDEEHAERAIRRFYEFDDSDLAANRQGQLSERQLGVIRAVSNQRKILGNAIRIFSIVISVGIMAILGFVLLLSLVLRAWNSGETVGMTWGSIGITALLIAGYYFSHLLFKKANANYVLRTVQGPVTLSSFRVRIQRSGRSYLEHHMKIGEVEFVLEDELVGCIKDGENVAIYYLDYQDDSEGIIQSMEKLAENAG
jgi:hypothetical protein